jgi:hypothetical protein
MAASIDLGQPVRDKLPTTNRLIKARRMMIYQASFRVTRPSCPAIAVVLVPTTTLEGAMTEANAAPAV